MSLMLYLLGAALMGITSVTLAPKARMSAHVLSAIFWPVITWVIIIVRVLGLNKED